MIRKTNSTKGICIDAFRCAGRDLFPLILNIVDLLHAYNMESVSFISDVFSMTSRAEQLEIIISTLQQIQNIPEETSAPMEVDLPCPIVVQHRIGYNSMEAWKYDNREEDNDPV